MVTKCNKDGHRANFGLEKTKKQDAIAVTYCHEKSGLPSRANQMADKLYKNKDFKQFCGNGLW